jgi:polysaccharide export outer membrane protein
MNLSAKIFGLAMIAFLASCANTKSVPYLVDAESLPSEILASSEVIKEPTIMPGDLLNIDVTAVDMTSVAPFNKGMFVSETGAIQSLNKSTSSLSSNYEVSTEYYLVSPEGEIDFPVIGKIHVSDLTKEQVAQAIFNEIYPKFIKERPTVSVRLMNFRVSVMGAVRNPGMYVSKNERLNFLEAIALAGDLDIKGERENILLYRTNADGTREVHRLNINDKNFLLSPYFNLQQNDLIYVVPNKSLANTSWQMNPSISAAITVVGGLSSIASLVIGIVNLAKD